MKYGLLGLSLLLPGLAAVGLAGPTAFTTPLEPALLDQAVTAEWVSGQERPRQDYLDAATKPHFPNPLTWVVVMPGSRLGWGGIRFGEAATPGPRHLRVGLRQPVGVGTVLTRGTLSGLSVLKPTAPYPGDLGDDRQWTPAARMQDGDLSVWVLPPGTTNRAFRLTCDSPVGARPQAGALLGMYVLSERYQNLAPEAFAFASRNSAGAAKLADGSSAGWDNGDQPRRPPIAPDQPEWVACVWPRPVTVRGLCAVRAVFGQAEVQSYVGPADRHPREAAESDWQTVATATCAHRSPESFNLNWFDFGRTVTTRAIRLRILSPAEEGHYLKGQTRGGRRCLLDEVLLMGPLGASPLPPRTRRSAADTSQPPIPVSFSMPAAGHATLVIEDAQGTRVRNLVSDTFFDAGNHTMYWDGLDESGRIDGPYAGIYRMVGQPVAPGTYTVRGLMHQPFDLRYEFSVYSPGSTPWLTGSHWGGGTGGWLADHSAPAAVLALPGAEPGVLLTSPVAESSHGIIWTDLAGRKRDGKLWVGGNWTGASHLARDAGPQALPGVYAYSGIVWEGGLRLVAFRANDYRLVAPYTFAVKEHAALGGLAVHNGLLVASLPKTNVVLLVDAAAGKVLGTAPLPDGRGLTFDAQGRLLALSGQQVLRFPALALERLRAAAGANANARLTLPEPAILVAQGLLDPHGLTLDAQGRCYVSDWGASHQVKVFGPDGAAVGTIGMPGGAQAGPYDPRRMDHPQGLAITADGNLWVAEASFAPKRVSIWTPQGELAGAFYGPPQYGGGGTIDPEDPGRFYYGEQGRNTGLEFALDWTAGTAQLKSIYYLPGPEALALPHATAPQTAIHFGGRQYMTDVNNSRPIGGPRSASIWQMVQGLARPVASLGDARDWPLVNEERFRGRWPNGREPGKPGWDQVTYAWSDLNGDAQVSSNELGFADGRVGSLTVNERLEFCTAGAEVFAPERFTGQGAPVYDVTKGRRQIADFFMREVSSGSGQVVALRDGWTVGSGGPVRGIHDSRIVWTYPNEWPGQQAGVFSTPPTRPGELMATTRFMGTITPRNSDAGELVAIDGDKGNVFLITADGLLAGTLFHDVRLSADAWTMPEARRGMSLRDITLYDEEFWTTATQTRDGKVYLVAGKSHASIVRVDGLESITRLKARTVEVTPALLEAAAQYRLQVEQTRLHRVGRDRLTIRIASQAPAVDGVLDEWTRDEWVTIDEQANARLRAEAGGLVEASLRVAGERLYVAYRTREPALLSNGGDAWQLLFKTGGALDLMVGASPAAAPGRTKAEAGDFRLLVTRTNRQTVAVLYQPVAAAARAPAAFSSPWRTVNFERVVDLSSQVAFAMRAGDYEFSVPLAALGLTPQDGLDLRGDVGILRGNGFQTLQRIYWQNKATSTVADVPTEATLTPHLWGIWQFQTDSDATVQARKEGTP